MSMEQFAPHPTSVFEGYYSKFDLPSGAHIALIICTVPNARSLPPHMVSFTYYPASGAPIFQREHWVASIERRTTGPGNAFELLVEGMGSMSVDADSNTKYDLHCAEWTLEGLTAGRTSWNEGTGKSTPEGWLVRLPLPLHWHVHSLASPVAYRLDIPSAEVPRQDQKGRATIHQEKNWASSFPSSHVWVQARNHDTSSGICLAGGRILGMDAFILGYRSEDVNIDILPPFALSVLGFSPFMAVHVDYANRAFSLSASNFRHKVVLMAKAPRDKGWFGLGSPFPEGHRSNFCTENFLADVEIEVFERRGLWGWGKIRRERFRGASLEFAGGYFPDRGKKRE